MVRFCGPGPRDLQDATRDPDLALGNLKGGSATVGVALGWQLSAHNILSTFCQLSANSVKNPESQNGIPERVVLTRVRPPAYEGGALSVTRHSCSLSGCTMLK